MRFCLAILVALAAGFLLGRFTGKSEDSNGFDNQTPELQRKSGHRNAHRTQSGITSAHRTSPGHLWWTWKEANFARLKRSHPENPAQQYAEWLDRYAAMPLDDKTRRLVEGLQRTVYSYLEGHNPPQSP